MNTKLTLTIEKSVIEKAKKYARARERSLSALVENYLKALVDDGNKKDEELTPIVKLLKGSFKMPEHFNHKEELTDRLAEKYL